MGIQGELILAGCGVRKIKDITLEVFQAIKESDAVYFQTFGRSELNDFLRQSAKKLVEISPDPDSEYHAPTHDLFALVRAGRKVLYLTYGHPILFCGAGEALVAACRENKIPHRVLAGISFLDSVFAVLGDDVDQDRGFAVKSTDGMLAGAAAVDSSTPLWVTKLDALCSSGKAAARKRFCARLKASYPAGHRVYIVRGGMSLDEKDTRRACAIEDLDKTLKSSALPASLFIPGA